MADDLNYPLIKIGSPILQTEGNTPFWTDKEFTKFQLFSFARYVEAHRRIKSTASYQEIFKRWNERGRTDY